MSNPDPKSIELLRFTTAGSVDDGKSTLIGRLLHDSKSIFEDQWDALQRSADLAGGSDVNLANLTDGLRSEREQGITIDVAYRYFATPRRKFIIADTPGHVQYTRNMVTGASTANLALVLIDARHGVVEQSKRHAYISSLLGIPHMVVCINKMDLVDYSEDRFREIREQFYAFVPRLDIRDVTFVPISALKGDNVVEESKNMPWYHGPTLLGHLEDVYIASDWNLKDFRMPVQYVIRPLTDEHHDFRGFAGQITGGVVRKGEEVTVLPSGKRSAVKSIHILDKELDEAFSPQSVVIQLEDDIDISRGDTLSSLDTLPYTTQDHDANLCWMSEQPLTLGRKYILKHGPNGTKVVFREVVHTVDIETLEEKHGTAVLGLNDIGRVKFKTMAPLVYDAYRKNRNFGGFVIIDEASNETVAAGMLRSPEKPAPVPEHKDYVI
ncbi:MAG: 50S ribosome-binding GTPase [Verrucomicrobia bacterium]|nr:50S ribosome-binding GTPase [Verrucomicrobiota bacterium]MCH8512904.1 50S ribosome-binding GTPase [Kiritimatiellia bacterium]